MSEKKRLVILGSGSGSNAQAIIDYFRGTSIEIAGALSNKQNALILERARNEGIPDFWFTREDFQTNGNLLQLLVDFSPDLIVLAGFLWKMPKRIIDNFPNKIINIHPSLLPKYGGKGMYGMNVHEKVFENGDDESGLTIHYVNERYDEGATIFQKAVSIRDCQTANEIAARVLRLEHEWYPKVIQDLLVQS